MLFAAFCAITLLHFYGYSMKFVDSVQLARYRTRERTACGEKTHWIWMLQSHHFRICASLLLAAVLDVIILCTVRLPEGGEPA